ncbi:MAG: hypothetical protein ABH871_04995 [Pseudomonadota bacterium]
MMRAFALLIAFVAVACSSCSKPLVSARVDNRIQYFTQNYAATPNDTYYAVRWALKEAHLPVAEEDLPSGVIKTSWVPTTSDSHYLELFDRRDYGATNSYFQLEIHVEDGSGRTQVKVGSRVKTLVNNIYSSGEVEQKVLAGIGNYLRKSAPELTNLGVNE